MEALFPRKRDPGSVGNLGKTTWYSAAVRRRLRIPFLILARSFDRRARSKAGARDQGLVAQLVRARA